jgi:hypothetical protein
LALTSILPVSTTFQAIGVLALLTGWTRVIGGFHRSEAPWGAELRAGKVLRMVEAGMLGGFEMLLGCVLVFAPSGNGAPPAAELTPILVGWAIAAAATLFTDAWRQRTATARDR